MKSYNQKNIALGSEASITIVSDDGEDIINALFDCIWLRIFNFEKRFSRFLPKSELSNFNRQAGSKVIISDEFRDILLKAKNLSIETGGLFNPFLLPAIQRAGYTKSFLKEAENDVLDDYSDKVVVDMGKILINDDSAQIPYGTAIDLGGCGKGYLADELTGILDDKCYGYSISLGGDIICAGHNEYGLNFKVTIQDANSTNTKSIGEIRMPSSKSAVASSGTITRNGLKDGNKWHHIIDSRSLKPSNSDIVLSTIMASNCMTADVIASCIIILGSNYTGPFLKKFGIKNAYLQIDPKLKNDNILIGKDILVY